MTDYGHDARLEFLVGAKELILEALASAPEGTPALAVFELAKSELVEALKSAERSGDLVAGDAESLLDLGVKAMRAELG